METKEKESTSSPSSSDDEKRARVATKIKTICTINKPTEDEEVGEGEEEEEEEEDKRLPEQDDDDDDYSESDEQQDGSTINFPAISPISNTSSGFISCGSSSSSKPTTPTPSNQNLLTDKSCDHDDMECGERGGGGRGEGGSDNNIVLSSDNESGEILAINKRRDIDFDSQRDSAGSGSCSSSKFLSSPLPSTSSGSLLSAKAGKSVRSKHRNFSFSSCESNNKYHHHHPHHQQQQQQQQQQPSTVRYRQSKKHISLDDEIVIYESDSSLIESRRRISNHHTMFNRISSSSQQQNQGRSSAIAAISRHKSEEHPSTSSAAAAAAAAAPPPQPSNQIVSILKRKDSSGKDSPLVTFSPNVKDIEPTRSMHRHSGGGILKKRSSLDESSRRYRSHSPSSASSESEKGCLIRTNSRRRNSCEEIHQHHSHGILKQKSYESTGYSSSGTYNSSGVNTPNSSSSSGVQGILKKPSLTPSDHTCDPHTTKHVSISEAVILAAAELCKDMIIDDSHEPYIKPILKMDSGEHHGSHEIKPKPILKKNHSSENEEIRSILKSRKSSREEPPDDMGNF